MFDGKDVKMQIVDGVLVVATPGGVVRQKENKR